MEASLSFFMATLLFGIGIFSLILGLVVAKFASGKTKKTGMISLGVGLFFLVIWAYLTYGTGTYSCGFIFWDAILAVGGAIIGAVVGVLLFLFSIMYS